MSSSTSLASDTAGSPTCRAALPAPGSKRLLFRGWLGLKGLVWSAGQGTPVCQSLNWVSWWKRVKKVKYTSTFIASNSSASAADRWAAASPQALPRSTRRACFSGLRATVVPQPTLGNKSLCGGDLSLTLGFAFTLLALYLTVCRER